MPQIGWYRLGNRTGKRPKPRRRPPIQPPARLKCAMCVYSWTKTSRSQSSVLPMLLSTGGAAALISMVL